MKPPTFVQIRQPAPGGGIGRKFGIALSGLAIAIALGWAMPRPVPDASSTAQDSVPSRLASALDLYPEAGTPLPDMTALASVDASVGALPGASNSAAADAEPAPPPVETSVRLKKGDTVSRMLGRLGIVAGEVAEVVAALAKHMRMERLAIGQLIDMTLQPAEVAGAEPVLLALSIRPEPRREYRLERDEDGDYSVEEVIYDVTPKLQRAAGEIEDSVIASAGAAGVPHAPLAEMLRALSWDVNFQHDIKPGDRFDMLIERSWTSDGVAVDGGRVLWAELTTGGGAESYNIYRFKPRNGEEYFYDAKGLSVVKALLRTPLNMSRISSHFGLRRHPVLGFTRLHAGVDFAAPAGTPVLAAGAGSVIAARVNGGYGRWVKIRHDNGLSTAYAHLSRIASGVRARSRVRQGQVIGFVGSTGLSTGPHLHFELHRGGRPVDPASVARTSLRTRLQGQDLVRFTARVAEIETARESAALIENPRLEDDLGG
ncbi:MAG: peptidoglycan DD-metalloendopeptidase family protein [Enhydrobacter sp.]|nr:peptidoglycan DD-metalloendopeptidase family protein [Enhydrobacter sp.]